MEQKIVNCGHRGKIIQGYVLRKKLKRKAVTSPEWQPEKLQNGMRQISKGKIQCYRCRKPGIKVRQII